MLYSLDVGCGYTRDHMKKGEIGVDIKRGLCDVVASAYHLPFKDNCFEKVIMSHILEHLTEWALALKEATRVLTQKGILQIEVPNPYSFGIFKDVLLKRRDFYKASEDHICAFGENELRNLLTKLNYELISLKYVNCARTEKKLERSSWLKRTFYNLILPIFPAFRTAIRVECKMKSRDVGDKAFQMR